MKKILAVNFLLMVIMSFSCSTDELKEDLSDIPDWDYSNAVGDDEAAGDNNSATDKEATDNIVSQPDESEYSDDDQNTTPDDPQGIEGCGNEKVEYEERCDSKTPLACSSLNPSMDGITYCLNNCEGYDMLSCDRTGKSWGLLNLRFETKFILDEAKIGDFSYFSKGALPYAAFNGIYGDAKNVFPSVDNNVSFAVTTNYKGTFTTKRQLFIKQNHVSGGVIGYPRHELEFSPGTIKKGSEYRINGITLFDLVDNLLKLVRYRLIDNQGGTDCIMGIGYSGTVFVNNVVPDNADLFDGGIIEVVASNVDFYHPDDFPGLNEENPQVPEEVLKYPVCQK